MATKRSKPARSRQAGAKAQRELLGTSTAPPKRDIFDRRYDVLLARRVPLDAIVLGRAYVIHGRRGGVGVAVRQGGQLGYRINREKWGEHFMFTEIDWAEDPQYGTAIPLRLIDEEPPEDDERLLAWLAEREKELEAEIRAAWKAILGNLVP